MATGTTCPQPVRYLYLRRKRGDNLSLDTRAKLWSNNYFVPLFLWAIWAALALTNFGGMLRYRWHVSGVMAMLGAYWLFTSHRLKVDALMKVTGAMVLLAVVSTLYSFVPGYTFFRAGGFGLMILFAVWGISAVLKAPRDVYNVYVCLLISSLLTAVIIIIRGGMPDVEVESGARYQGVMSLKATGVAGFVVTSVPLFLFSAYYHRPRWRPATFALMGILVLMLIATRGRTGIFSAMLVFPIAWAGVRHKALGSTFWGGAAFLLVMMFLGTQTQTGRIILRLDAEDISTGRLSRAEELWAEIVKEPLLGYGFGSNRYILHQGEKIAWSFDVNRLGQRVNHNQFLVFFYDIGFLGFALFCAVLALGCFSGMHILQSRPSTLRMLGACLFASWLYNFLNTVSHDGLDSVGNINSFVFWMKTAMLVKIGGWVRQKG